MFSFGRRDAELSPTHRAMVSPTSSVPKSNKKMSNNKFSRSPRTSSRRNKNRTPIKQGHVAASPKAMKEMNFQDTTYGIEISLDLHDPLRGNLGASTQASPAVVESREPQQLLSPVRSNGIEAVISVQQVKRQCLRVHKTQLSLAFSCRALPNQLTSKPSQHGKDKWGSRREHRIPLKGKTYPDTPYDVAATLLQQADVQDEYIEVKQEYELLSMEIAALTRDRNTLQSQIQETSKLIAPPKTAISKLATTPTSMDWDLQKLLDSGRLLDADRKLLQQRRGNCFTFSFSTNASAKDVFLTKCGIQSSQLANSKRERPPGDCITIEPKNCRPGGAGTGIRHIALMSEPHHSNHHKHHHHQGGGNPFGFFIGRDTEKSQTWGRIPSKLYRRVQQRGGGHGGSNSELGDMIYLSTGPLGCYYAEFQSGECWWGNAIEDDADFHSVVKRWDIYRVVFGPIQTIQDDRGKQRCVNSWIIIARDGRVAWKNVPHRLHQQLERRMANSAALAGVSLGPGGSYFCRFLDGSVDYCLPASMAKVCDYIDRLGGHITEVHLHPEISQDFCIRHTELR